MCEGVLFVMTSTRTALAAGHTGTNMISVTEEEYRQQTLEIEVSGVLLNLRNSRNMNNILRPGLKSREREHSKAFKSMHD